MNKSKNMFEDFDPEKHTAEILKIRDAGLELHAIKCGCGSLVVFDERPYSDDIVTVRKVEETVLNKSMHIINTKTYWEIMGQQMDSEVEATRVVENIFRQREGK